MSLDLAQEEYAVRLQAVGRGFLGRRKVCVHTSKHRIHPYHILTPTPYPNVDLKAQVVRMDYERETAMAYAVMESLLDLCVSR